MQLIKQEIERAVNKLGLPAVEFTVEHPKDDSHGEYSTNVALVLAKRVGKKPRELAEELVGGLNKEQRLPTGKAGILNIVERIEVAGGGFINFYLKPEFFVEQARLSCSAPTGFYGRNDRLKGKKVMVEYTDPNPFKEFHIGHLMSNTIGESLTRLFEASGAEVKRANYQGDVGLHVAKSIWGMRENLKEQKLKIKDIGQWELKKRQEFMGAAYAYGATKYESDETAKAEMHVINKQIYEADPELMELYQPGRAWSLEYFETIYARLGTKFDEYFFESEAGKVGLVVVAEGLAKGVLEVGEEGAVVYKGEKDGMHTRVFRNKLGLPTYEAKDLGLAKTKYERYKYDLSYIVTANEITEYFKVVLRVMEQLYPELRAKTTHMPHGMMKLTTGKMSSRTGVVVTGEGLLNDLQAVVLKKMGERSFDSAQDKVVIADGVAVGALKYTVLKQAIGGDIVYEPETMTNLEGNTGPYIQYTYARASSILKKFKTKEQGVRLKVQALVEQETALLRWIYRYPEVVEVAAAAYAPHLLATYIFELAARFNTFYQACRVEEEGKVNELRYLLTQASANVLKSGLGILGIVAPEEM